MKGGGSKMSDYWKLIFNTSNIKDLDTKFPYYDKGEPFRYKMVKRLRHALRQEMDDLLNRVRILETYEAGLQRWLESFPVCPICEGNGKIKDIISHDNISVKSCTRCNSTGLISKE